MKLIITGGTGFIGGALCRALQAAGHEVVVLTRRIRHALLAPKIRYVTWRPGSVGEWEHECDGADGIVNLAGESVVARWTARHKQRLLHSRLESTKAVIGAIGKAKRKPAVLVNASAIGYYGPRGDEFVDERVQPGSDFLAQLCQQWETVAQSAQAFGVRVVCLRIGLVLARDGGVLARMLPPFQWGLGGPLGSGRQWVSWIQRDDLIRLIQWALEDSRPAGIVNATSQNPVTMNEFAKTLGRVLHRPAIARVPAVVLRMLFGEMSQMLLTGQRVVPSAALHLGFTFRYPFLPEALAACLSSS